jgi:delta 1-pyrroline-5-carboxylate dehydrogenase
VKAEAALARRRERRRARALALELELAEEERRTNEYLQRQAARFARLREDHRLDLLLASREAGKPVAEAIAEVERRFSSRRAS